MNYFFWIAVFAINFTGHCIQDEIDSFVGTVVQQQKDGQYEVSFSNGRWILPAQQIEQRANTQLGLTPDSVAATTNKGFTTLTGYKQWIYKSLDTRSPTSIQIIFKLVQNKKPKAKLSLVLRAVRLLETHGYIRKSKRHRRSYVSVVRKKKNRKRREVKKTKAKRSGSRQNKNPGKNNTPTMYLNTPAAETTNPTNSFIPNTLTRLKGGAGGLPTCEVYADQETGVPYSCELTKINLDTNENKFINMQLLKERGKNRFWFYWEWGKTGQQPNLKKQGPFVDVVGKAAFEMNFKLKTGIYWCDRFTKKNDAKYCFVNPLETSSKKLFTCSTCVGGS